MFYELVEIYLSIVIQVDFAYNLIKLLTCGWRAFFILYEIADFAFIDESIVVGIEKLESFFELFLAEVVCDFCGEGDEFAEGYFSWIV